MENPEEVLHSLDEFAKLKPKDIPKELDDYLHHVASSGDPVYQWSLIKSLFRQKLLNVITEFYEMCPVMDIPPCPNVDPFNYETMKTGLLERFDSFASAPFTIQRISELLTEPRKQYKRVDKYMRAIEKNIWVVSTREPGRREVANVTETTNLVNGVAPPVIAPAVTRHPKKGKSIEERIKSGHPQLIDDDDDEEEEEEQMESEAAKAEEAPAAEQGTQPESAEAPGTAGEAEAAEQTEQTATVKDLLDKYDEDARLNETEEKDEEPKNTETEERKEDKEEEPVVEGAAAEPPEETPKLDKEPESEEPKPEEPDPEEDSSENSNSNEGRISVTEVLSGDPESETNETEPILEEPEGGDAETEPEAETPTAAEAEEVEDPETVLSDDGKRKREDYDDDEEDESPPKKLDGDSRILLELEADASSSPDDTNLEPPVALQPEVAVADLGPLGPLEEPKLEPPPLPAPETTKMDEEPEEKSSEMIVEEDNVAMEVDDSCTSSPMAQEETLEPMDEEAPHS